MDLQTLTLAAAWSMDQGSPLGKKTSVLSFPSAALPSHLGHFCSWDGGRRGQGDGRAFESPVENGCN